MNLTLQLDEPLAMRLQKQAAMHKVSLTEFVYQFLDTHWGEATPEPTTTSDLDVFDDEWDDDDWDEWNSDEWLDHEGSNSQQHHNRHDSSHWETIYAELRELDPEHEAEIDRKYGTGIDVLHNSSGLIDTGLPVEEIRYIIESPELSQQSIWVESNLEPV